MNDIFEGSKAVDKFYADYKYADREFQKKLSPEERLAAVTHFLLVSQVAVEIRKVEELQTMNNLLAQVAFRVSD